MHGLTVIDKPAGMTSHDVVGLCRKHFGERRIGHAGTLDPDATGVLLIGVGNATRLLRFLTALGKTYTAEVVLGTETNTLDASGTVTATHDMSHVTFEQVQHVVRTHLTGPIMQVPPMVSALKVDGRRLHELAREGIEVERVPRPVTVHHFAVEATTDPLVYRIEVTCSSGTYVRTLAADLGELLGGGGHLRDLRRTACGSFGVDEAHSVDGAVLLSPRQAMRDYEAVTVSAEHAAMVRNGRSLDPSDGAWPGEGPWAVCDPAGDLLAMYESVDGHRAKPAVVLPGTDADAD
ncbi:MAG: tRNA pseudouridine(55) synthase TruB [Actinomycetota bacterium]|jgi:tRNA pseudouridine55 synthase